MGICYFGDAGEFTPRGLKPQKGDFVIAADGGYLALCSVGIQPDLLMGDLDSLGSDYPLPSDLPLERFPVQKDDTDTGIALAHGWKLGYRSFALYGCSGGRVDHLLANWQSMCRYSQMGAEIRMAAADYDAYAITNQSFVLPKRPAGTTVSVFCHGDHAEGVSLEGLMYSLSGASLTNAFPLGVSNQRTSLEARISVADGTLLVLQYLEP